jgi:hypothetical protein
MPVDPGKRSGAGWYSKWWDAAAAVPAGSFGGRRSHRRDRCSGRSRTQSGVTVQIQFRRFERRLFMEASSRGRHEPTSARHRAGPRHVVTIPTSVPLQPASVRCSFHPMRGRRQLVGGRTDDHPAHRFGCRPLGRQVTQDCRRTGRSPYRAASDHVSEEGWAPPAPPPARRPTNRSQVLGQFGWHPGTIERNVRTSSS